MPGREESQPDTGATVELALSELEPELSVERSERLRDHLPGLEAERQLDDWGRSERVSGLVDRTLYSFLYHYWFRVEVEGAENLPDEGGALVLANRAGPLPSDAAMITKAIVEEHPRKRTVHVVSGRPFRAVPLLGMVATKIGAVLNHPANLFRLLYDEGELVLAFPEGPEAAAKPVKERYRLRRFDPRLVEAALRARVPIVPAAVVGGEEAMPVLGRISALRRLTRLPVLPLSTPLPLPAKFRIRFLEPVATADLASEAGSDPGQLHALGHEIRALIQENLLEMVIGRRSVWLG